MKKYTACFLIGGTVLSLMACAKKDLTTNPSTMENQMMSESGTSQVKATDLPIEDILNQARKAIGNGTVTAIEYEKGNPNYRQYQTVNLPNGTKYIRSKADGNERNNIE